MPTDALSPEMLRTLRVLAEGGWLARTERAWLLQRCAGIGDAEHIEWIADVDDDTVRGLAFLGLLQIAEYGVSDAGRRALEEADAHPPS